MRKICQDVKLVQKMKYDHIMAEGNRRSGRNMMKREGGGKQWRESMSKWNDRGDNGQE